MAVIPPPASALQQALAQTEVERRRAHAGLMTRLTVVAAFAMAGALLDFKLAVLIAVLGAFPIASYVRKKTKLISAHFHRVALPLMVADACPALSCLPGKATDVGEFNASGLFDRPDRYQAEHLFAGQIGETAVRFGMVNVEDYRDKRYSTLFAGLFIVADFSKEFVGRTLVRPGSPGIVEKWFGDLVQLEDPRFMEKFYVTTTDQVAARYILTPSLMERIMQQRGKRRLHHLAFVDGLVALAVPYDHTVFEISLMRPADDAAQLARMRAALNTVVSLIDELGLNERIWSKGAMPMPAQA